MTIRQQLRYGLEYAVFRACVGLFQCLSLRGTIRGAALFSWLMTRVLPAKWTRTHVARENLRRAFGPDVPNAEVDRLIAGMWRHLFRLVVESCQLPRKLHITNCREIIVFRNRAPVLKALCSGRPVLILGGHFGNWEVTLSTFGVFGFPSGVVVREMDNPWLHRWFARARERYGHRLLMKDGGWNGMVDALRAGGSLALLADQDAGRRGMSVDFFGSPASTHKSIALMALEYDALIVMGYGVRLPDDLERSRWARFEIGCEAVLDPRDCRTADPVRELTQAFSTALERAILRAPEQYFWVHRRWKTDPETRRKPSKYAERRAA